MKRLLTVLLALLLAGLTACGSKESAPADGSAADPVTLVLATDLHYISPRITDNGEAFQITVSNGDGKTMYYIQEIMDAFVAEMVELQPDAVLLTGDLTFSGAKASHEDLTQLLAKLQDAGVPVLAIPGNHDLDSTTALSFSGADYAREAGITAEEYAALYAPFGLEQALSRDEHSLSYVYAVRSDLRVLMLDTNAYSWCSVSDETLEWVEKQLKDAKKAGARVISASHQNMDVHMLRFTFGYQIVGGDDLRALYEKYDVLCNLSGHLHIQHIIDGIVPEIATSALSINPNQYGVVTYDGETFQYDVKQLDVSAWAAEEGLTDPNLLDFATYAYNFMVDTAREKQAAQFADSGLTEEQIALVTDTFARLNAAYFAGEPVDAAEFEEGMSLWPGGGDYLATIAAGAAQNHRSLTISVK